jgi:predicted metal-dependent phosphoesterase TrpH
MHQHKPLKVDLHVHTEHSEDSRATPMSVVDKAIELGFDAIAVTDHNTVSGSLEAERLAKGTNLLVIPGQEVLTKEGEVVVLGLREGIPRGMPALDTMRQAREKGGFVIVPHPFDLMRRGIGKRLGPLLKYVDAIEVFNSRTIFGTFNSKALSFAERNGLPMTAGSDSHSPGEMGKTYMLVRSAVNQESLFEAVRSGNSELVTYGQGLPHGIRRGLMKIRTYF